MSDDIDRLKRDYQAIRAPDYLATRVRAETREDDRSRRAWLPAMATIAVAVAAITVAPVLLQTAGKQRDRRAETDIAVIALRGRIKQAAHQGPEPYPRQERNGPGAAEEAATDHR